ncbi:MAG TPA: hypothetical protein VHY56_01515 [Candidatus Binataceae bacterium]|nr:hypothetical protein [Candidatus Binataceae bacterium]
MIEAGVKVAEARRRLREGEAFALQVRLGHDLKDGAILTSVSDRPFEMSFKCSRCGVMLWFEEKGSQRWRLHAESREHGAQICRGRSISDSTGQSAQGAILGMARH